jgi:probable F420-dependent oxidoreductase
MKIDTSLPPSNLNDIPDLARAAEAIGFEGIWTSETQHSPFLPGPLIAEHTNKIEFGTAVAIAFARSPASLAYTAWDLAQASGGRFILGLGTQVKGHIERRFGMPWPESVVGKLREQIGAIRAFWYAWQNGKRLKFKGEYYRLSLMSPFFDPGPIEHPEIPIFIAGVNKGLARLAGQEADGFHVHPFNSPRYLEEVLIPSIETGARETNRSLEDIRVSVTAFTVSTPEEENFVRMQIAFYASTPSYRGVFALHGWGDKAQQLTALAAKGEWGEMGTLIDDEILNTFAVVTGSEEIPSLLRARYKGLADRLTISKSFTPGDQDGFWEKLIKELK